MACWWRHVNLVLVAAVLAFSNILPAAASQSDYFVKSLPGTPKNVALPKMHAGHIEIKPEHHGNIFFWLFDNQHIADKQRTIIWLNGGPGCSSMDGALMEVGPFKVKEGGELYENPGRWNEFANLLFVDNPLGTGFSFVDTDSYIHDLPEMATDFLIFLDKFFDIFPQYQSDDLYIAGESYAGMYIPYIADAILSRNNQTDSKQYPLKGILLGNGWIDPARQYLSYLPFAYESGIIKGDSVEAKQVEQAQGVCIKSLQSVLEQGTSIIDVPQCEAVLDKILDVSQDKSQPDKKTCRNMYDVRKFDNYPSCGANWPEDLSFVTPYLRDEAVTKALHISPEKKSGWVECAGAVSRAFTAKNSKPASDLLPRILEQIPVLMFNGDKDIICNHLGNEDLIGQLKFNGGTGFEEVPGGAWAPREVWTYEGHEAGYYQSARNLTYVLVHNASHMVPFDLPLESRDMLHRFIGIDYENSGLVPPNSIVGDVKNTTNPVSGGGGNGSTDDDKKIKDATKAAYYRAGELALIIVTMGAVSFAVFVIYQRHLARTGGYRSVAFAKHDQMIRMEDGISRRVDDNHDRDVNELDELVVESPVVTSDEIDQRIMFDSGEILTEDEGDGAGSSSYGKNPYRSSEEDTADRSYRPRID
ncbi:Alpha/Beta hydrolase protein [Lipomyces japonicus]|uniref:Alpha/Beta hydrolase protein n=1 Tax=Lipomyces japonicus TaxID=56871 RepID=UPI0034CD8190